ncbi:DUF11 domain-containing protein [Mariniblastus fucicola]|uniref:DUF11 domain-containing protein n=1 Tax=Mariniblastus fucicola TaxID=980251 RepID=A0A5B9P9L4_9BACT|nr:DUF11 domain-containing protein [Mariniblastus fucicola]QEG21306.1 hypothetical protein MFFC18_11610 [Mariniblastus fucicola]
MLLLIENSQAQEANSNPSADQAAAIVASQTGSVTNYALLQPISSEPKKTTLGLLQPMTRSQPAARPQPMVQLQPMAQSPAKPVESPASSSTTNPVGDSVVVTPHAFKRGVFDQHEFKVHNASPRPLRDAKILLRAPVGSVVQQVTPKPDSVDGLSIMLTVEKLSPGESQMVEVTINYPRNEFAQFESTVLSENWVGSALIDQSIVAEARPPRVPIADQVSKTPEGMLQPSTNAMLKPKVPAMTVSAETRRVVERGNEATTVAYAAQAANTIQGTGDESVEAARSSQTDALAKDSVIKSYLQGPAEVVAGKEVDFSITVQNLAAESAKDLIVQLSIPDTMKVTILDRAAWYDAETRKVSWKLANLDGRSVETIRYKAVVKTANSIEQSVIVGGDGSVESTSTLTTTAK